MMNLSISKKRRDLEKPTKLRGMFEISQSDAIADLPDNDAERTISDRILLTKLIPDLCNIDDFGDAERMLVVKDDPSTKAILCREKGCQLAEEGKMSEAVTKWQEGLYLRPSDHLLHELTAQGFLALDQNLLALKSALRAVEICPDWTEGLLTLARAQREIGELEASLQTYIRIIELDPKNIPVAQEMKDLGPLLTQLQKRKEELLLNVESSGSPDEIEANTCILNLSTRVQIG